MLQEMSARLGVIAGLGVGDAIRQKATKPTLKLMATALVISAIFIGNSAYEAGNITGAVLGFEGFFENMDVPFNPLIFVIGALAFLLLYSGKYHLIERTLVMLVGIMGMVFFASALLLQPDFGEILQGLFLPKLPNGAALFVMGIIGTTVVPYNLFLHASAVKQKWAGEKDLATSRWDAVFSVLLGGLITMCILLTSAMAFDSQPKTIETAADLSVQLQPILGDWAGAFLALGFLAAGLSSSITAPLAAAFATSEVLGWGSDMRQRKFRYVWGTVLLVGLLLSFLSWKPTAIILFAQVANGLLLPVIAGFLLWIMNDKKIMGNHANTTLSNTFGIIILLVALSLGLKIVFSALNII